MVDRQNTVLTPADNVRDAWRLLTLEPLREAANDSRYVDCSEARGTNVVGKLSDFLSLHSMDNKNLHLLFTGFRGDGKTTELFQFISQNENRYRLLYFDAEVEFDLLDFRFPDFLLGIARTVFERMGKQELSLSKDLIQEIADWFETLAKAEKSHAGRFQKLLDDLSA